MSETLTLPVLPLDDGAVLPGMVVPLDLSEGEVRAAVEAARAVAHAKGPGIRSAVKPRVLLVPRLNGQYAAVGTLGVIEQEGRLPGGEPGAVVRGVSRVRIGTGTTGPGVALWVEGQEVEIPAPTGRAHELAKEYKGLVSAILQKRGAWQVVDVVQKIDDPSELADNAGYAPYLSDEQKVEVLETADTVERLTLVIGWARDHLAELDVAETIRKDVQEGMEKTQREFLLRQQMDAIRKELNELNGDPAGEEDDYRARIEAADLPEKVREAALKEVDKLERSSDASPEGGWIRTWLDTVLDIPWNERTEDAYDIAGAREVLDADHAGLDDVKERVIEYLAVRKRRSDRRPPTTPRPR
ncbi:LON peptidase substrate-binding domain-containing protein, partial [Spirillospora sp. NPDC049652]